MHGPHAVTDRAARTACPGQQERAVPWSWRCAGRMALQVANFRAEHGDGLSFPCVSLLNRRGGGAPRMLRWIFQRHLEILLFNRGEMGGSSGAIWKALSQAGLESTSLCCAKKAVAEGLLTEEEFAQIMQVFKESLPPSVCDPSSLGRIRSCTLLPLASAAVVCRQYGRSPASTAWLRAFSQPIPDAWLLYEEQEANAAGLQVDLALQDKLERLEAEQHFEAEELSFAVRFASPRSARLPFPFPPKRRLASLDGRPTYAGMR